MRHSICLQRFAARARRPCSRLIAGVAAVAMLATTASPVWAGGVFSPNNLVVSRSVYAGTASTITVGETLPPGCTAGPVAVPLLLGGTVDVIISAGPNGCNAGPAPNGALFNGTYPFVFNNDAADSHFGITAPIFLDHLTTSGALLNTLPIDSTVIDTSFSSKSELAINKSVDGLSLTFMGYVAGPGFTTAPNVLDVSNASTPGLVDPTNPAVSQFYRSVAEVDASGNLQITKGNAYSGDNGRAAMKGGNSLYYIGRKRQPGKSLQNPAHCDSQRENKSQRDSCRRRVGECDRRRAAYSGTNAAAAAAEYRHARDAPVRFRQAWQGHQLPRPDDL